MTAKKWISLWIITVTLVMFIIGSINYAIDPLWTRASSNTFNKLQIGTNERQQKTNHVYFNGLENYNGILLGTSRSTYINQNDFYNMNIYNYAVNSMRPFEYKDYIDFVKEIKGKDLKYIIIGSDFFVTNKYPNLEFKEPSFYINQSKSFLYKYKLLFSYSTLKYSLRNIKNYFNPNRQGYTRFNVKYNKKVSEAKRQEQYTENLKIHTDFLKDPNYVYDENYIKYLKHLKEENKNAQFIIFTSPISADLLVSIINNANRWNEYTKWLKELVNVFGEVHHFMNINSITTNLQNYPDDDHVYPHICKLIANKLSHKNNSDIPEDFGILLTKENIDNYLQNLKKRIKIYNLGFQAK